MVTNNSVNEPTAASGKVLQGQGVGVASAFSTATYPSTATGTGKILRADGTNFSATTATYPDTAGSSGNVLTSDGTNWSSSVPAGNVSGPVSSTNNAVARFDSTTGKIIKNSSVIIDDNGQYSSPYGISVNNVTASTPIGINCVNSDTNAASFSQVQSLVNGSSAADAFFTAGISGGSTFSWGIDNSVSGDPYVMSPSTTLGTSNVMTIQATGSVNLPLQPCFSAHNSGAISDISGDGTTYTIIFDTKDFDQQTNYNTSTGLFTAPVAGKYMFSFNLSVSGILVGHTSLIVQMTNTSELIRVNPTATAASGQICVSGSILISLSASSTIGLTLTVSGSTKTVDIPASPFSRFQGYLVC